MNKGIFLVMLILFQIAEVKADNYSPVVRIESPKNYSNFEHKAEIAFKGKAIDLEDGDLSGEALIWTSDIDGRIGQGNSFSAVLSQGSHIVILTATDSEYSAAMNSIFITIGTPREPISEVEKPKEEKPKLKEPKVEKLKFEKQSIPSIEFLFVPPFGSFENLQGQILNTDPNKFAVAIYTMVEGVWFSKPSLGKPVSKINKEGKWICDITIAENDELAIKIVAYLIPIGYQPPLASGEFWILKEIERKCLAKIEVIRKIRSEPKSKPEIKKPEIKESKSISDLNLDKLCDRFVPGDCWLIGLFRADNLLAEPLISKPFNEALRDIFDLKEETRQKINNIKSLLFFSTLKGSVGLVGGFDCFGIQVLLEVMKTNVEQIEGDIWRVDNRTEVTVIDDRILLYFQSGEDESLAQTILDRSYLFQQSAVVQDALRVIRQADVVVVIDCEQIPELFKDDEIIDSDLLSSSLDNLKSVTFSLKVDQDLKFNIDLVFQNVQSARTFLEVLKIIQQFPAESKEVFYLSDFSFHIQEKKVIVWWEIRKEEFIQWIEKTKKQ